MRIVIDVHFVLDGVRYHVRPSERPGHYEWTEDYGAQVRRFDAVPYGDADHMEIQTAAVGAQLAYMHEVARELGAEVVVTS